MTTWIHRPFGWISLRSVLGAVTIAVILVVCGREVAHGAATYVFLGIGACVLCVVAVLEPGLFIGTMVLAALDGIPFIDTSRPIAAHITQQDLVFLVLFVAAVAYAATAHPRVQPTRIARTVSWCGLALVAWCVFTVLRTWAAGDASLLASFRFGRDFAYFGALLMVLPRLRLRERDIKQLVAVLTVGVSIFSVGQFLAVEGIARFPTIVHAQGATHSLGLLRIYAPMNDLLLAGVAFGLSAVVLARRRAYQLLAIPLTLMLTVSLVVELTRARWVALIVSIVVVSLWLALQGDRRVAVRARRRLGVAVASLAGVIVGLLLVAPSVISTGTVVQRLFSIFSDVGSSSSSSTIDVRTRVASYMLETLSGKWPIGVGLVPPSAHFYATLPLGSLRDQDLGVLNAVMTIGAIGAALIYVPLIVVLVYAMRRTRAGAPVDWAWLNVGGQIWIVATIVSSLTLITLFSVSGLVMSAAILMLLCQPVVSGREPRAGAGSLRPLGLVPGRASQARHASAARR